MGEPSEHSLFGRVGLHALNHYAAANGWDQTPAGAADLDRLQPVLTELLLVLMQAADETNLDFGTAVAHAREEFLALGGVVGDPFPGVEVSTGRINTAARAERELADVAARIAATEEAGLPVLRTALVDRQALLRTLAAWSLKTEDQILAELRPQIAARQQLLGQEAVQAARAGLDFPRPGPSTAPPPHTPAHPVPGNAAPPTTHRNRSRGT